MGGVSVRVGLWGVGRLAGELQGAPGGAGVMPGTPRGASVMPGTLRGASVMPADHKYVMVLHDHQANPHVHVSVRAESIHGKRLNPRKADLHRWRETFAEKLRGYGVEAEATRQATRGQSRNADPLWRLKVRQDGRLRTSRASAKAGAQASATRAEAVDAWTAIGRALAASAEQADRDLARSIAGFVQEMAPLGPSAPPRTQSQQTPAPKPIDIDLRR